MSCLRIDAKMSRALALSVGARSGLVRATNGSEVYRLPAPLDLRALNVIADLERGREAVDL